MNNSKINSFRSTLHGNPAVPNAQSLEEKITALLATNSPIESISPLIYTDRKDGVMPEYNIRTDRMEIALDVADKIASSHIAMRQQTTLSNPDNPTE